MTAFAATPPSGFSPLTGVTWNASDKSGVNLSSGNLTATGTAQGAVRSVQSFSTGKYYYEITTAPSGGWGSGNSCFGIANSSAALGTVAATPTNVSVLYRSGNIYVNNAAQGSDGVAGLGGQTTNGCAIDFGAKLIWFRNVSAPTSWNGSTSNDPATGVGGKSFSGVIGPYFLLFASGVSGDGLTANFDGSVGAIVDLAGNIGGVSLYGKGLYGAGLYSQGGAFVPAFAADLSFVPYDDFAGSLPTIVSFAGDLGLVFDVSGDFAPVISFSADLSVAKLVNFDGDLAPQISLAGDLSLDIVLGTLEGSFGFTVTFAASGMISGPLWTDSDLCPPTLWTPTDPCDLVEWEDSELCNG